jgi:thiamine-monophosphate kinase
MPRSEAQLIERYFMRRAAVRADVRIGIGDDAAVLAVPRGHELALTTDVQVEGVHFLPTASPRALGHRALAVNLSDIAAMGAVPSWMLLSLVLPQVKERWLREFSRSLSALAKRAQVALVGGNLSRGPLSITIMLAGLVPSGGALRRDRARPGDDLYVSGTLGDSAGGLRLLRRRAPVRTAAARYLRRRFEYPQARVALGQALRDLATACIDVSDGLYVDARRLLAASNCSATLETTALPLSAALRALYGSRALTLALTGGEDYELCFTAPARHRATLTWLSQRLRLRISRIGRVRRGPGELELRGLDGNSVTQFSALAFDHFGATRAGRARRRRR